MSQDIIFEIVEEFRELFGIGIGEDLRNLEASGLEWLESNGTSRKHLEEEARKTLLKIMASNPRLTSKVEDAIAHFSEEEANGYNEFSFYNSDSPLTDEMVATMHEVKGIWPNLAANLVKENYDIIKKAAAKHHRPGSNDDEMEFNDLIGVGGEALWAAAQKMEENPRNDFRKFALQVMSDKIRSHQKQKHPVPFKTRKKIERLKETREQLNIHGYSDDDKAQLADALGMTTEELRTLQEVEAVWGDGTEISMGDQLEELEIPDLSPNALDLLIDNETQMRMSSAMTSLSSMQRQVILNIYFKHNSFRETAKHLDISLKAVKKHHRHAMEKLRDYLEE